LPDLLTREHLQDPLEHLRRVDRREASLDRFNGL
jgi:hypothetical protein